MLKFFFGLLFYSNILYHLTTLLFFTFFLLFHLYIYFYYWYVDMHVLYHISIVFFFMFNKSFVVCGFNKYFLTRWSFLLNNRNYLRIGNYLCKETLHSINWQFSELLRASIYSSFYYIFCAYFLYKYSQYCTTYFMAHYIFLWLYSVLLKRAYGKLF